MTDTPRFPSSLQDAFRALPAHVCDALCVSGEESAEQTFTAEDGHVTVVHGPRDQVEKLTGPPPRHDQDRRIQRSTVHLPVKIGAAARAAAQAQAERDHPDDEVSVDCWGGTFVIPRGFAPRE